MELSDQKTGGALRREEIWGKEEILQEHKRLLAQDCAQFLKSDGNPVAAGVAAWVPCPFCGGEEFTRLFHQGAYHWERCRSCGLLQKRPRPTMAAMSHFYAESLAVPFYEEMVLRADRNIRQKKIFNPYLERLSRLEFQTPPGDRALLDIGCASGLFLAAARERGLFSGYAGVEPNAPSAAEAEKIGFHIYQAMFEDAVIPPARYDIITCFSMFQFICEPVPFLKKCKSILRPGGWVIMTSGSGWGADILLLQKSSPVLPGHMLQLLDPGSFERLCQQVGLSAIQVEATGELDVQLVQETWRKYPPDVSNPITDFLHRLFVDLGSKELATDLQHFLKKYNLSGHLWMQASNS